MRPQMRARRQRGGSGVAASGPLFEDTFTSGDLSKSSGGFNWFSPVSATVINTATVGLPNVPSGSGHAVRFSFNTTGGGQEAWAELSFNLVPNNSAEGYTTLFLRYYVYYPTGSEGGTVGPQWFNTNNNGTDSSNNNKFLRLYDAYARTGTSIAFGASTRGNSVAAGSASVGDETLFFETGAPGFYGSPGDFGVSNTFLTSARRGTWNKVEFQLTSPTTTPSAWNAGNGIMRMWVNDSLLLETISASQSPANTSYKSGYLMGYQNCTIDNANARLYLADFAVSSTGRV